MMVPVIDQPASLRATRVACAGVIRSTTVVTRRNVWLGSRSSALPSASTRMRYAEPRWLPSVITVTPARPSTGNPALPPVRSMTTTYGPLGVASAVCGPRAVRSLRPSGRVNTKRVAPGGVGVGLVLNVRQPLEPRPVRVLRVVGEHPDLQQVRRMEHREMTDHRGQQARRAVGVAADGDRRKGPQLHQFRAVVDQTVGAQELRHPHVADGFEVRLRRALRPGELAADRRLQQPVDRGLGADADPGRRVEVGVDLSRPLPVGADDRQQVLGMRCVVVEERHLCGRRRRHPRAQSRQIAQVFLAVGVDFGHLLAAGPAAGHEARRWP